MIYCYCLTDPPICCCLKDVSHFIFSLYFFCRDNRVNKYRGLTKRILEAFRKSPKSSVTYCIDLKIGIWPHQKRNITTRAENTGIPIKDARLLEYEKSIFWIILHSLSSLSRSWIFFNFEKWAKSCILAWLTWSLDAHALPAPCLASF